MENGELRATIEAKLTRLRRDEQQLLQNLMATRGAIQVLEQVLAESAAAETAVAVEGDDADIP